MRLRPARPEDGEALARIHRSARETAMPWLPVVHTPDEDLAFFKGSVLAQMDVSLAQTEGVTMGFIALVPGWVEHLYVAPSHWRSGAGTALLQLAKSRHSSLDLWTFQRNAMARSFYERHGFVAHEQTDGNGNEEGEPDIRYRWVKA